MKVSSLGYIEKDEKYLMLHRSRKKGDLHYGKYNGLGGKVEKGESPEDCLKREIFEESGLTITNFTLRGVITFPDFQGDDDWIVFVYKVVGFEGKILAEGSDEGSLEWVKKSDLHKLNMWEGDIIFLDWIKDNNTKNFFSATFRYTANSKGEYFFDGHSVVFY